MQGDQSPPISSAVGSPLPLMVHPKSNRTKGTFASLYGHPMMVAGVVNAPLESTLVRQSFQNNLCQVSERIKTSYTITTTITSRMETTTTTTRIRPSPIACKHRSTFNRHSCDSSDERMNNTTEMSTMRQVPSTTFQNSDNADPCKESVMDNAATPGSMAPLQKRIRWSKEEDDLLIQAVQRERSEGSGCDTRHDKGHLHTMRCQEHELEKCPYRPVHNWTVISSQYFQGTRTANQCKSRWKNALNPKINREPFTADEDRIILQCRTQSVMMWGQIAKQLPGRTSDQIRDRFFACLDPTRLKATPWSSHEDALLREAQLQLGNKWVAIAKKIPGRSDLDVKNRWYNLKTAQRRSIRAQKLKERLPKHRNNATKEPKVRKKTKAESVSASSLIEHFSPIVNRDVNSVSDSAVCVQSVNAPALSDNYLGSMQDTSRVENDGLCSTVSDKSHWQWGDIHSVAV